MTTLAYLQKMKDFSENKARQCEESRDFYRDMACEFEKKINGLSLGDAQEEVTEEQKKFWMYFIEGKAK